MSPSKNSLIDENLLKVGSIIELSKYATNVFSKNPLKYHFYS